MTAKDFHIDAIQHLMDDGRVRRCWIQNKDLRKIRLAIHERESRTWWQTITRGITACLGVFLW